MHPALQGLLTIVIGVGACVGYFYFANRLMDWAIFPARDVSAEQSKRRRIVGRIVIGVLIAAIIFEFLSLQVWGRFFLNTEGAEQSVRFTASLMGVIFFPLILLSWIGSFDLFGVSIPVGAILVIVGLIAYLAFIYVAAGWSFYRKGANPAGRNINRANQIRPWIFLFPAIFALGLYLAYPVVETLRLSFLDRDAGNAFVGLDNYKAMIGEQKFREALGNNMLWLIVVPAMSTGFGLLAAQLTDRIAWGNIAKSLIFMPMAISFVGAGVIWKLVYEARPEDVAQIGVINAILVGLGGEVQNWLQVPFWNNFFLMIVLIWIQTGFAMVILSAALRGIPEETVEAAIIDGAGPFQIFFKIKVPQIMPTIVVVWTTITLTVLKVFDIVFTMTNGQWNTQVLANYMYDKLFRAGDWGVGSAAAIIIMLLVTPILVWNVYNARKEMR